MKIIKTYENYNSLGDLDLGRFSKKIYKSLLIPNEDGTFDYIGNLDLANLGLKSLSEIPIRFKNIYGCFRCANNYLISLKYSPETISENFHCYGNNLISLQYAPKEIGGEFTAYYNFLLSDKCDSNIKGLIQVQDQEREDEDVIKIIKALTYEQQIAELDFFEHHDKDAFERMKEILDSLGVNYGPETRRIIDYKNTLNVGHLGL